MKLDAALSVQPRATGTQDPSSTVARALKLDAVLSVQPLMVTVTPAQLPA